MTQKGIFCVTLDAKFCVTLDAKILMYISTLRFSYLRKP